MGVLRLPGVPDTVQADKKHPTIFNAENAVVPNRGYWLILHKRFFDVENSSSNLFLFYELERDGGVRRQAVSIRLVAALDRQGT